MINTIDILCSLGDTLQTIRIIFLLRSFKTKYIHYYNNVQWNLSTKAMLGVKSFNPCREFGCFQSLFFIVVDHCVPFTLAVVKSQVVLQSPFVVRFHCIYF